MMMTMMMMMMMMQGRPVWFLCRQRRPVRKRSAPLPPAALAHDLDDDDHDGDDSDCDVDYDDDNDERRPVRKRS